ncbi:Rieske (2Fe-2S) protein [Erythrobacter alti]|uniref:Rieske (2Fe-2S) protein n=1 Tax=Erythrobacter alti TaxID=1896145 RepID=UPI0030F4643D
MSEWHPLAEAEALEDGQVVALSVGGLSFLLVRSEGNIHAIADQCSHAHQKLACGMVRFGWIACPAHGARFLLETGEPLNPPATEAIATYPVRTRDGVTEVCLATEG